MPGASSTAKPAPKQRTKPKRGRPKKFDEAQVLEIITDLFWKQGFAATSLDAIAAATGVARPSLYAAFGSKEAMYLASIDHFLGRISAAMEAAAVDERGEPGSAAQADGQVSQALGRMFGVLVELYGSGDVAKGCLIVCTAASEAQENPRVKEKLSQVLAYIDGRFEELLALAQRRGELCGDADVQARAAVLSAVTHSLAVRARGGASQQQLFVMSREAVRLALA